MTTVRITLLAFALPLLLPAPPARSQAVTDPNQIVGEARLVASNPAILDVLSPSGLGQGLVAIEVSATSLVPPELTHETVGQGGGSLSRGFDLTVESSLAGIPYGMAAEARFDSGRDEYFFAPATSPPVFPDPAPDAGAGWNECLSLLDVRYVFDDGSPLEWSGGRMWSSRETGPGSDVWSLQARNLHLRSGDSSEFLPIRGGARHSVLVKAKLSFGSDPEVDTFVLTITCEGVVDAPCDEMIPFTCVIPRGDCELPPDPPGRIVGVVDVLGEHEIETGALTVVEGWGPGDNRRRATLRRDPSSGPFQLINLLPSEAPEGWYLETNVLLAGDNLQGLTLPALGAGLNPAVDVRSGETTDIGDAFVLDPGHVVGRLRLSGPPPRAGGSLLLDLTTSGDDRGTTAVIAHGIDALAPGATRSAVLGRASSGVDGSMDLSGRNFTGTYRLALGGLYREPSLWTAGTVSLRLRDTADPSVPEAWHDERLDVLDHGIGTLLIEPGDVHVIDRAYCFSEVQLQFRSTTGTFVRPNLTARGEFTGTDYAGNAVTQSFVQDALGTPRDVADASDRGMVAMALPQGDWVISPRVDSLSPRGALSDTELPPIDFPVGCRQVIKLSSQLVPIMGTLPECVSEASGAVDGSFRSEDDVVRLQWRLNGGPPQDLCSPCGVSPSFAFPVTWEPCENELMVEAEDSEGRIASVTGYVTFDGTPPVVTSPVLALWPPNHQSWCWEDVSRFVSVTDECPIAPEWTLTSCRSDQPDDVLGSGSRDSRDAGDFGGSGDGTTTQDCVISADRRGICVRAERLGGCPDGRAYSVGLRAVDGCGNVTETALRIVVPHDWKAGMESMLAPPDARVPGNRFPFPVLTDENPDAGLPDPYKCGD